MTDGQTEKMNKIVTKSVKNYLKSNQKRLKNYTKSNQKSLKIGQKVTKEFKNYPKRKKLTQSNLQSCKKVKEITQKVSLKR